MQSEVANELLLTDYKYLSESFWKNEQVGETRVNFYIGLTTAITAGLVALINAEHGLAGASLRLTLIGGTTGLLILGVITLLRLLIRNKATDEYKQGLDTIRQTFKDRFDRSSSLVGYYAIKRPSDPVGASLEPSVLRKFGGLVYMVAAINSVVVSGIVAALVYRVSEGCSAKSCLQNPWAIAACALLALLVAGGIQFVYASRREKRGKDELREGAHTHAFGIVFKSEDGPPKYALVRPKMGGDEWVLPKGHIEKDEGHGEAALREVREETGVLARMVGFVGEVAYKTDEEAVRGKGYLLEFVWQGKSTEERKPRWFTREELLAENIPMETRYLIELGEKKRLAPGT